MRVRAWAAFVPGDAPEAPDRLAPDSALASARDLRGCSAGGGGVQVPVPRGGREPPLVAGQQAEAADRALSADLIRVEQVQQKPPPLCRRGRERRVERIGGI